MSNKLNPKKQFHQLLSDLLEGQIDDEKICEIIELAESDIELKNNLRNQLETDHLLTQALSNNENAEQFVLQVLGNSKFESHKHDFEKRVLNALPSEAAVSRANPSNSTHSNSTIPSNSKTSANEDPFFEERGPRTPVAQIPRTKLVIPWALTSLSLAASVVLSVFIFVDSSNQQQFNTPNITYNTAQMASELELHDPGVAIIANTVGLTNPSYYEVGSSVTPGHLEIEQGFLELEFYNGAQLKISGPAELDIINEQRVRLIKGKVMTDVPRVAIGFTIDTPNSEIVDLGTSIGVEVDDNGVSEVHVFDGLIEARDKNGDSQLVKKGGALQFAENDVNKWKNKADIDKKFQKFNNIDALTQTENKETHQRWLDLKQQLLEDPALVAYWDFEKDNNKSRQLTNLSKYGVKFHGAVVGATWTEGPWPGKQALAFKRPGDRVRIDVDEKLQSFTMAAWVKIDSLDRYFNALLLTDGYKPGDIHWQLRMNILYGSIVMGLNSTTNGDRDYVHTPFFSAKDSGTWYHLAMTVNQNKKEVKTYVNGKQVDRAVLRNPSEYWRIGQASIGNWNSQMRENPLRNLNGSIAEMVILRRPLSEKEVGNLALLED